MKGKLLLFGKFLIDIFFAEHEQAMNFGLQRARVRIVKGDND